MKTIFSIILLLTYRLVLGQGSCDARYLKLSDLSKDLVNKNVIIDFHHEISPYEDSIINHYKERDIYDIFLFETTDSLNLNLFGKSLLFNEYKSIGVDGCSYVGNGITNSSYIKDTTIKIEEAKILEITNDSIIFEFKINFYPKGKSENVKDKEIKEKKAISKSSIDGFIIRKRMFESIMK